MPIFLPIILIGTTIAGLVGQALIPTKVSEKEKKEIIQEAQTQITITKEIPKQNNFPTIIIIAVLVIIGVLIL